MKGDIFMKKNSFKENFKFDTKSIVVMGTLIAIEIVLARFVSISAWNLRIGFSFVPVAIAAMLLGPVKAGIVGALSDFIGAVLFPIGPYFPGFTLTAFLTGVIFGVFLYKKQTFARTLFAVGINQLILSQIVNTYWISVLYGSPFSALFVTRILQSAILIPVQLVTLAILSKVLVGRLAVLTE